MEKEVRITFRAEVYIKGGSIEEIKDKWDSLPLFSEEAKAQSAEFVELVSVEDAETYEDLQGEFHY